MKYKKSFLKKPNLLYKSHRFGQKRKKRIGKKIGSENSFSKRRRKFLFPTQKNLVGKRPRKRNTEYGLIIVHVCRQRPVFELRKADVRQFRDRLILHGITTEHSPVRHQQAYQECRPFLGPPTIIRDMLYPHQTTVRAVRTAVFIFCDFMHNLSGNNRTNVRLSKTPDKRGGRMLFS